MRKLFLLSFLFLGFSLNLISQTVPSNGLLAWYPFNGNANDLSSNNFNGTVNGASLTTDRFGNANSAYDFDGVNDFIEVTNNSLFNFDVNDDFTISVWVKANNPITNNSTMDIIAKWVDDPGGSNESFPFSIRMKTGGTNNIQMTRYDKNCSNLPILDSDFSATVVEDEWHNLTYVKNGNSLLMYFDGALVKSIIDNTLCDTKNTLPLFIGKRGGTNNDAHFHGKIDDLAIYQRALGVCEINELLGFDLNSRLKVYYPFNGDANDLSGNGNNAIVNGALLTTGFDGSPSSAYQFDGLDDFIFAGDIMDVNTEHGMTFSAWIQPQIINGINNRFVGFGIGTKENGDIGLRVRSENDLRISTHFNGGRSTPNAFNGMEANSGSFNYNQWIHVVGTYRDGQTDIFLNGNYEGTNSTINGTGGRFNYVRSSAELNIGRAFSDNNALRFFHGKLDEIRIYNRILTDCEIANLYSPQNLISTDTTLIVCSGDSIELSTDLQNANWFSNNNLISSGQTLFINVTSNSTYVAKGLNECGCTQADTFNILFENNQNQFVQLGKCKEDSFLLSTEDSYQNIEWFKNGLLQNSNSSSLVIYDTTTVLITLNAIDSLGCRVKDTFLITSTAPMALIDDYDEQICLSNTENRTYQLIGNGFSDFNWMINGGSIIKNDGLEVIVDWEDLDNAQLEVFEITRIGCIGDTIEFPLIIDQSEFDFDLISFSKDFRQIEFSGNYNSDEDTSQFSLKSQVFDTSVFSLNEAVFLSIDTNLLIDYSSNYRFSFEDFCGNIVDSDELKPILLESSIDENEFKIEIKWDNFSGWNQNDINTTVFEIENNGNIKTISELGSMNQIIVSYNPTEFQRCFYLESYNNDLELLSRSELECIEIRGDLFIPNVITPNNDGYNDCFLIPNLNKFNDSNLSIYNRYGQLIYEQTDYDMTWCAENVTSGVYFYYLLLNNREISFKGFVEVIK